MKTVKEVAEITGVSVRTLHYYDEISLLKPTETTEAGYRLYDGKALSRLQQILFFRELGFPLREIRDILDAPSFDARGALQNHKRLLVMERDRLDRLIRLADETLKGDKTMSFKAFDKTEIEAAQKEYAAEARERWGQTDAYRESEQKTGAYGKQDWEAINGEMDALYAEFAANSKKQPDDPEVEKTVRKWQALITRRFYNCTDEILAGLGQMYAADPRFRKNIDKHGEGLADFMSRAIAAACSGK